MISDVWSAERVRKEDLMCCLVIGQRVDEESRKDLVPVETGEVPSERLLTSKRDMAYQVGSTGLRAE